MDLMLIRFHHFVLAAAGEADPVSYSFVPWEAARVGAAQLSFWSAKLMLTGFNIGHRVLRHYDIGRLTAGQSAT
jgi:hypothetical protein